MKKEKSDQNAVAELTREWLYKENKWLWEENKKLRECNKSQSEVINNVFIPQRERLEEENKKLKEKLSEITMVADDEKQSIEHILELEEEIRSLELEKRNRQVESEELKMWLREKLPLALLKEYMAKFEWVDLKNV